MTAVSPAGRRRLCALSLTVLVLVGGCAAPGAAAELRLAGLAGGALAESDLASGDHVLLFFAGWSPRCRDIVERSDAVHGAWNSKARVALVDFQEKPAEVRKFFGGRSPKAPIYLDGDGAFAKKYSVTQLPFVLVFRGGEGVARGRLDDRTDGLIRDALR